MIIAVTGHRPEECEDEEIVRARLREALSEAQPARVIVGMAAGVDLWAGDEALSLGLTVWAAKPWAGHRPRKGDEELYARVLDGASEVVNVTPSEEYPGAWCYHKRNEWMVDHATHILTYWNGRQRGGTFACLKYTKKVGKPIRNVHA